MKPVRRGVIEEFGWRVAATIFGLALVAVFAVYVEAERNAARQHATAVEAIARADKLEGDLKAAVAESVDTYAALLRSNTELAKCSGREWSK